MASDVGLKEYVERLLAEHMCTHEMERSIRNRDMDLTDRHFVTVNNFREQLDRERGHFVTRETHETLISSLNVRLGTIERHESDFITRETHDTLVASLNIRLGAIEKYLANTDGKLIGAGAVISLISLAISIASHFWK